MPKYIDDYLFFDTKISQYKNIYLWSRLAANIINGGIFINFDNKVIESNIRFKNHLLYGCWSEHCDIKLQKNYFKVQEIINEYISNKEPYKYTQCWVFAAVFHSICELKGLKSRVVIGKYTKIDLNKNYIYDHYDSIWSFHVWNEIWIPEKKQWYSIDCCPNISMDKNKIFVRGPINIKVPSESNDYKYFKHLTTGDDVEIYTYEIYKRKGKLRLKKIILSKRYQS